MGRNQATWDKPTQDDLCKKQTTKYPKESHCKTLTGNTASIYLAIIFFAFVCYSYIVMLFNVFSVGIIIITKHGMECACTREVCESACVRAGVHVCQGARSSGWQQALSAPYHLVPLPLGDFIKPGSAQLRPALPC